MIHAASMLVTRLGDKSNFSNQIDENQYHLSILPVRLPQN